MLLPHAVMLGVVTILYTGGPPWNTDLPPLIPKTDAETEWVAETWLAANFTKSAPEPVTDQRVSKAITRAKEYLLAQQQENGLWPEWTMGGKPLPGPTSMAAFEAAIVGGTGPQPFYENKQMAAALDSLVAAKPRETRNVALRVLVLGKHFSRSQSCSKKEPDKNSRQRRCRVVGQCPEQIWRVGNHRSGRGREGRPVL